MKVDGTCFDCFWEPQLMSVAAQTTVTRFQTNQPRQTMSVAASDSFQTNQMSAAALENSDSFQTHKLISVAAQANSGTLPN